MKFSIAILLLVWLLSGCSKKDDGTAAVVDQEKLDSASAAYCPTNQKFQVYTGAISLGKDRLPNPVLYAIQKGSGTCASLHNIDHGGISSWLKVTYSTDCILNGSLWAHESFSVQDGDDVYFNIKSLNPQEHDWIHIYTSYGYSTQTLNSEMGLIVYSCSE